MKQMIYNIYQSLLIRNAEVVSCEECSYNQYAIKLRWGVSESGSSIIWEGRSVDFLHADDRV